QLGLPGTKEPEDHVLIQKADEEIFRTAPELSLGPVKSLPEGSAPIISTRGSRRSCPYRLYRFMAPPSPKIFEQRNIAFIGAHLALNAITVAQAQALWITAFFQNQIPHLNLPTTNMDDIQYQTILQSEYCRLRHPPEGGGAG